MKIETDIPAPKSKKGVRYPFAEMKVGDSLFLAGEDGMKMASAALAFAQRHPGWKCARRTVDGGIRVWRIE